MAIMPSQILKVKDLTKTQNLNILRGKYFSSNENIIYYTLKEL